MTQTLSDRFDSKPLAALLTGLDQRRALWQPRHFGARAEAIELVETQILERIAAEEAVRRRPDLGELGQLATSLLERLEKANSDLLRRFEVRIVNGQFHGNALREELLTCAGPHLNRGEAYDSLDMLVAGLLRLDEPKLSSAAWDPEMVPYQPTPARYVLELIDRADIGPEDAFVDVGSGLGQVPILVSLLTGAGCIGVEAEPDYCTIARRCAERLNLAAVRFVNADARAADFSEGTVFYLYTPFEGTMLRQVLRKLEAETAGRRVRVCTLGPCTETVSRQSWLTRLDRLSDDPEFELGVFAGG